MPFRKKKNIPQPKKSDNLTQNVEELKRRRKLEKNRRKTTLRHYPTKTYFLN